MNKKLGVITGHAAMRVVRTQRACLTLNHNPSMQSTDTSQHRTAPGRFAQRFALRSKDAIPKAQMDTSVRSFLNDLTRAQHRTSKPFGQFWDAAIESVRRNPATLPNALAVVDAFAGELIAAAGVSDSACFNERETALDEATANHLADDRFILATIQPSREAIEAEVEALEAQKIATERRILCLTKKLSTYDRSPAA